MAAASIIKSVAVLLLVAAIATVTVVGVVSNELAAAPAVAALAVVLHWLLRPPTGGAKELAPPSFPWRVV